jgi:SH3-like domain-containing protein
MTIIRNLFFIFWMLVASACTGSIPVTGASNTAVGEQSTPTLPPAELPTVTLQPTSTATPLPHPTITPFVSFNAVTLADYVNVRTNPGLLFAVNMNVPKGTVFTVLGKTPGGGWIYVQTLAKTNGWVYAKLLKGDQDLSLAPLMHPDQVQIITGRVVDEKGAAVSGINFAIVQGSVRNEVMTDADGTFYIYLPTSASGEWAISYIGIDCSSSLMDAKCNCKADICGAVNPPNLRIQVPENKPFEFIWK